MTKSLIHKIIEIDNEVKEIRYELDTKYLTKQEFYDFMDPLAKNIRDTGNEVKMLVEWIKRVQNTTDRHEIEINVIKNHLDL